MGNLRLLTDEEIDQVITGHPSGDPCYSGYIYPMRDVAKAQAELTRKETLGEVESYCRRELELTLKMKRKLEEERVKPTEVTANALVALEIARAEEIILARVLTNLEALKGS